MRAQLNVSIGVDLDVIQSGDPAGVPLVLLHGLSDSNVSMRLLMDRLPNWIRAIAITQRGHGDSSKPAGPYAVSAFVADLNTALDRLGVSRAFILGHSMSSVIAQRFAIRHPERVSGLVLVGAFPGLRGNPAVADFYEAEIAGLEDPIDPAFALAFQESTLSQPVPPPFLDLVVRESLKLPANAWREILQDLMADDTTADLAGVSAPTVLLWGDQDGFVSRQDQERLLSALPNAALSVFEDTGHAPHWEAPAPFAQQLTDFIRRHVAPIAA